MNSADELNKIAMEAIRPKLVGFIEKLTQKAYTAATKGEFSYEASILCGIKQEDVFAHFKERGYKVEIIDNSKRLKISWKK